MSAEAQAMTIPFSVSETSQDCLIQLRDAYQGEIVTEIFRGICSPGVHSVEFDPTKLEGGLDAGLYALYVKIGDEEETYPVQYMP
jgi:hypothetical protein